MAGCRGGAMCLQAQQSCSVGWFMAAKALDVPYTTQSQVTCHWQLSTVLLDSFGNGGVAWMTPTLPLHHMHDALQVTGKTLSHDRNVSCKRRAGTSEIRQ